MAEIAEDGGGHKKRREETRQKTINQNRYDTHGRFGVPTINVFRTNINV